jgi:hypothetical protein
MAAEFLESWQGSLPESCGGGKRWTALFTLPNQKAQFAPLSETIETIRDHGIDPLIFPQSGAPQNVYHNLAVFKHKPERGRGRISDVDVSPGFWLDVDVKDGAFTSGDDIMNFVWNELDRRGVAPHIIVSTGSGGRHLYWRTRQPLNGDEMKVWSERIWLWMQHETGLKLDNLSEPNRVFRLPGTLWLGKADAGEGLVGARNVIMLRNSGDFVDMSAADRLTRDPWMAYEKRRAEIKAQQRELNKVALAEWDPRQFSLSGDWETMHALYEARQVFMHHTSWDAILIPAGWEEYGTADEEGHRQWTRPGGGKKNPRSLITDWEGSPHVAKLMSDSPETGLKDLADAGIPLTKVNVAAALHFGGNVNELLFRFIKREQEKRGLGYE